ncbi:hypothetical protein [Cognatishimia activa]|uniref:hypothetical protein n=1 Tax=Cognatishimia activa TaxID=1715691 RepID=UPI0022329696|nr:hypothetical protein [Cognatishimia activa]UZD90205.1 hypothetical protein M0D42_11485 [Cognatishimia activa]
MPEQMKVKAQEHGLIRIFAVDLPPEEADRFDHRTFDDDLGTWPLRDALGADYLDEDFIEFFDVADLEELGLAGYMVQGLGIARKDVDEVRAQIDQISGHVLIVLSNAFDGFEQTLNPKAPLRWIGTFEEEGADVQFKPLKSAAAKGSVAETPPAKASNPHLMVLTAIVALPVLIGLIALIVWLVLR